MAVAARSKGYLGVWRTFRPVSRGGPPDGSQGALFSLEGERTKNVGIGSGGVVNSDVVWDGSAFVVGFSAYAPHPNYKHAVYDVVRCSRITPEGELSGPVVDISGTMNSPAAQVAVASDGAGTTLVAYEKQPEKADVPIKIGVRMLAAK